MWTSEPDGVWPLEGGEAARAPRASSRPSPPATARSATPTPARPATSASPTSASARSSSPRRPRPPPPSSRTRPPVEGRGEYDFAIEVDRDDRGSGKYPIVLVSYHIGCVEYDDAGDRRPRQGLHDLRDQRGGPAGRGRERRHRRRSPTASASRRRAPSTPSPPPADTGTQRWPGTSTDVPGHRAARTRPHAVHDSASTNDLHGAAVTATKAPTEPPPRRAPCAGRATGSSPAAPRAPASSSCSSSPGWRPSSSARRSPRSPPRRRTSPAARGWPATSGRCIFGTLLGAVLALLVATPLAVGIALYITYYAPRRHGAALGYVIDLLAAIPSVVYGFWGICRSSRPRWCPFHVLGGDNLGFIPLLRRPRVGQRPHDAHRRPRAGGHDPADHHGHLPRGVPPGADAAREAALALGATRWEMIRMAVLPYGKSGVIARRHARPGPGARRDDGGGDHPVRSAPASRST